MNAQEKQERIGTTDADGNPVFPKKTISGADVNYSIYVVSSAPSTLYQLGGGKFAVGDIFPPRGFDVQAAVDELRAHVAPKSAAPSAVKPAEKDEAKPERQS